MRVSLSYDPLRFSPRFLRSVGTCRTSNSSAQPSSKLHFPFLANRNNQTHASARDSPHSLPSPGAGQAGACLSHASLPWPIPRLMGREGSVPRRGARVLHLGASALLRFPAPPPGEGERGRRACPRPTADRVPGRACTGQSPPHCRPGWGGRACELVPPRCRPGWETRRCQAAASGCHCRPGCGDSGRPTADRVGVKVHTPIKATRRVLYRDCHCRPG